ncbi:integrase core domain-containing protein [Sphingomonas profundi]|uniref:integrase core domain-containing protein n=1 Tax=Alterirhizorhabdus profundi TaxID=2681549 RepID=UPI003BAE9210
MLAPNPNHRFQYQHPDPAAPVITKADAPRTSGCGVPFRRRSPRYRGPHCTPVLNQTLFVSLGHARSVLRLRRDDYNHVRPHSGVGGLTPADAARRVVQHRPEGHHTNPGLQL